MLKKIQKSGLIPVIVLTATLLSAQNNNQYLESEIARLRQMVTSLQDENANYQSAVADLRRKHTELVQDNKRLHEELRQIHEQVKNDAAARDAQLRKLSAQLEKIANMPAPTVNPAPAPAAPRTAVAEDYEEYIVQQGATLSEITRVYEVRVSDIMRANKLKSDRLRIGQRLLIPVKKK